MDPETILDRLKPSNISLGLSRILEAMKKIPCPDLQNNILVAGTNGKGSTAAYLASLLESAAGPTGLYTSPHLLMPHERIRLSGRPIGEKEFQLLVEHLYEKTKRMETPLTYFEFMTLAAAIHFRRARTRFNVLEVGLGGRLDATNAFSGPLAVITRISRDHSHILGETLEKIAGEKAGIMRPSIPIVTAPQRPEVMRVLEREARAMGADLVEASRLVTIRIHSMQTDGMELDVRMRGRGTFRAYSVLTGSHQAENLATALAAATLLTRPTVETCQVSISRTRWPGRLETIQNGTLRYLLDGAHNRHGLHALGRHLDSMQRDRPLHLVFGTVRRKNNSRSLPSLARRCDHVHLVPLSSTDRTWRRDLMNRTAERICPIVPVSVADSLSSALASIPAGSCVLCTGSLYLVSEVYKCLNRSRSHLITRASI